MASGNPDGTLPVDPALRRDLGLDRGGGRIRQLGWRALAIVAVLALVSGAILVYRQLTREAPVDYRLGQVTVADVLATVEATGTVEPLRRVEVGPEVSGRIASVHADYNDRVEEGQLLAEIDPEPIEAQRREAQARLRIARAGLRRAIAIHEEARRTAPRLRALRERGVVAPRELDAAESALAQAEAGLADARAQIALAEAALSTIETNLSRTSIRSPIDGIVLERAAEPGLSVAATLQPPVLFVLAEDLTRMDVYLAVDEADIGRIEPGQPASFTVDAYENRTFHAQVNEVRNAPRDVQGVVTYEVILQVDNADRLLRPGMTANANVVTARAEDAITVPNAALRFTPPGQQARGVPTVWVQRDDGSVVPVDVSRGIDDGRRTAVRGPLEAGDRVLIDVKHPEE